MHGVDRGVELCNVVFENVEMKRRSQQPSSARPRLPVAKQQTLSCVKERRGIKGSCVGLFDCFFVCFFANLIVENVGAETHRAMDAGGCR